MNLEQEVDNLKKSFQADRLEREIAQSDIRPDLRSAARDILMVRGAGDNPQAAIADFVASPEGQVFTQAQDRTSSGMTIDEMFAAAMNVR